MNSFEAKLTNPIDINTIAGGPFRLMPGQYRVTPDRQAVPSWFVSMQNSRPLQSG
jgi:hypothetical protein